MKKLFITVLSILAIMLIMMIPKIPSDDSAIYETFLSQNYPSDNIKVIMTDLTHDNHDEMIVLERSDTDYFSGMLHIYHVSDAGDVTEIYKDDVGEVQLGWRWYYLYKDMDHREYLVQYVPGIFGGSGVFALDVISFSSDGSHTRDNIAWVTYDTNHFDEGQQREMNQKLEEFKEVLFQYRNSSEQLIAVGSDMYLLEEDSLYFGGEVDG